MASIALGPALKGYHWIVTSGPSRCSNQPCPSRVVCAADHALGVGDVGKIADAQRDFFRSRASEAEDENQEKKTEKVHVGRRSRRRVAAG
jgi:hypothetical protein